MRSAPIGRSVYRSDDDQAIVAAKIDDAGESARHLEIEEADAAAEREAAIS